MRSHRNLALPRLMKPMLVKGYKFECIIMVRFFIFGLNLEVPIDIPVEKTSWCVPNVSRISTMGANLSS